MQPGLTCGKPSKAPTEPCASCGVRHLSICNALGDDEIGHLGQIVYEFEVLPRETIFREGDAAEHCFNVTSGSVKLYKLLADGRRQITGFLFEGDFLGLAFKKQHNFTAEAVTACTFCRFPLDKLEGLLGRYPKLEKRLLREAMEELAAVQDQMLMLGRKTALEKVASFLVMLSRRAAKRGRPGNPVAVPMNRSDIADYLGLTIETVSRTITQLKRDGVIAINDLNHVNVPKPEALAEIADGL
ncbi:MAG: helix-turn-helix domain-containing protein [Proteobacteria bacterium]|nr:helix-turn-helix domain-containing protein [Pseudomonadota bacterium]